MISDDMKTNEKDLLLVYIPHQRRFQNGRSTFKQACLESQKQVVAVRHVLIYIFSMSKASFFGRGPFLLTVVSTVH
jgi:type II secretory pathway component PulL